MFASNAPADYVCPVCLGVKRQVGDKTLLRPTDIVYSDETVTVFINSFFMGKNAGHVIVVPNEHFENIYDLPEHIGRHIFAIAKKCSGAIKVAYKAEGITIRQNNEPAGDQHAFHYHLHVFPRYHNDGFNQIMPAQKRLATQEERRAYAVKLEPVLQKSF